jgi:carboxyl-terminal processing protease
MDSDDIVLMIKGKENTIVRLKILRPNVEQPIEFAIKRQKVVPPSVESKVLKAQNTGYIRILNFSQEVPEQFDRELETVEAAGIKGLVIDLRGNPGGSLDAAIMILSRFIDNKLAVTLKFREENQQETYETSKGDTHNFKYPITVLVDGESASAAEIMAGVLKDYNKATLIGERTYGKFSVQTVFNQIDGAGIKLTIAHYFLPKSGAKSRKVDEDGTYISGGLDPDIQVKVDEEKEYEPGNLERDNQLARAVEFLRTGK